ncbi:putative acetyltransferase [Xylogone sp. PMI_703]|nr:putative acetyltransferase [Xylogone sp. PMI_703]
MEAQQATSLNGAQSASFTIRKARQADIPCLADVERSAAILFENVGLGHITGSTMPPDKLLKMTNQGYLWVAVDKEDRPIGFLGGYELDGYFYIAEISVAGEFQGKGVGRSLMTTMSREIESKAESFKGLALTTYRDLEWNGPWYKKLGFVEAIPEDVGPGYSTIIQEEGEAGHDVKRRCVMRKMLEQ